jgi:hypothetical protein
METLVDYFTEMQEANRELLAALKAQNAAEPAHLERLRIFEKNTDADDAETLGEEKDDEEVEAVMEKHKSASPFALDVAAAHAKLLGVANK